MAVYGLYKDIDVASLRQAISSLRSSAENKKAELEKINPGQGQWKAGAKNTFTTGVNDLSSTPFLMLNSQLNTLSAIADNIATYKANEVAALENKEKIANLRIALSNCTSDQRSAISNNIADIQNALSLNESQMENCQSAIEG